MSKALVVLSGGQDSTICLYLARQQFDEVYAITFDYNQRHSLEIEAAKKISKLAGVKNHEVLKLGNILRGKSPLTNCQEQLETYQDFDTMDKTIGDRVELTFVPMRNDLFLTLAANRAVCLDITDIYTGVCQADGSNYPDCTSKFIVAKNTEINEALGLSFKSFNDQILICAPLLDSSKSDSIKEALTLPGCYTALGYSHTSYSGEYPPITQDHATVLRAHGFEEAKVEDPLIVRAFWEGKLNTLPESYYLFNKEINEAWNLADNIHGKLVKLESLIIERLS